MASRIFGVKTYQSDYTGLRESNRREVTPNVQSVNLDAIDMDIPYEGMTDLTDMFKRPSRIGEGASNDLSINDSRLNPPEIKRGPTDPLEEFLGTGLGMYLDKKDKEAEARRNNIAGLRTASSLITAAGGVINAQSKYRQAVDQNNYNIELANNQIKEVMSDAARLKLRTQTKGVEAGNDALLAAIAQGQAVNSDMANKAVTNELMYAAQNMMNIEINSIRSVYNIQSQINSLNSASRIAGINRDLEQTQAIFEGVLGVTAANIGRTPKVDTAVKPEV
jgi:hypothetical protein